MSVRPAGGRLSAEARLVLIALAKHTPRADGSGAYPSQETLAEAIATTPRAVRRGLVVLLERSLIKRGDQGLVDHLPGNKRPVVYDLAVAAGTRPRRPAPASHGYPHWEDASVLPGEDGPNLWADATGHPGRTLPSANDEQTPICGTPSYIGDPSARARPSAPPSSTGPPPQGHGPQVETTPSRAEDHHPATGRSDVPPAPRNGKPCALCGHTGRRLDDAGLCRSCRAASAPTPPDPRSTHAHS
ncbi:helix-turn-helix domain-containing protein [Nostocoides japonicum]